MCYSRYNKVMASIGAVIIVITSDRITFVWARAPLRHMTRGRGEICIDVGAGEREGSQNGRVIRWRGYNTDGVHKA